MSDDFKVGDVVVCINDRICPVMRTNSGYRKGRTYRVAAIKSGRDNYGRPATGLKAVGLEAELYRNVVCFRKLPRADEQFTKQMRACKPERVPA